MRIPLLSKMVLLITVSISLLYACTANTEEKKEGESSTTMKDDDSKSMSDNDYIERGQYLVSAIGCGDCHSPKNMTDHGPVQDEARKLSGHPANSQLPPFEKKSLTPGNWLSFSPDITAFVGPWGVSYAANLTPDSTTGIGAWTFDNFLNTIRKGKHMGMDNARPLMPPMPWDVFAKFNDDDLKAIFSYLKSIPAISNKVPPPVSPQEAQQMK